MPAVAIAVSAIVVVVVTVLLLRCLLHQHRRQYKDALDRRFDAFDLDDGLGQESSASVPTGALKYADAAGGPFDVQVYSCSATLQTALARSRSIRPHDSAANSSTSLPNLLPVAVAGDCRAQRPDSWEESHNAPWVRERINRARASNARLAVDDPGLNVVSTSGEGVDHPQLDLLSPRQFAQAWLRQSEDIAEQGDSHDISMIDDIDVQYRDNVPRSASFSGSWVIRGGRSFPRERPVTEETSPHAPQLPGTPHECIISRPSAGDDDDMGSDASDDFMKVMTS